MVLGKWFKEIWADQFKRYLLIFLIFFWVFLSFSGPSDGGVVDFDDDELIVHYFYSPTCPHCLDQKPFNAELKLKHPEVKWIEHDITTSQGSADLRAFAKERGISTGLGVPATFFGNEKFIGFLNAETTGVEIDRALDEYVLSFSSGGVISSADAPQETGAPLGVPSTTEFEGKEFDGKVDLPLLGEINVFDYSLISLAVVLGLLDGFNPCAMWVLVYLITLIMSINDRRKIWLLVGSFVFASGVLYFLFMTAWLNVFLLIGYLKPLILIIGLGALFVGISDLKTYFTTKGALVCEVGDVGSKKRTMTKMQKIVESPLTWISLFAIIGLAFVVNSIEFACSAVIPVIFTQVLTLSGLSGLGYYGYILLYVFFFMLDDLIIFSLAALAVTSTFGDKYVKWSKLIGGIILVLLGLLLVFKPELLSGFS